MMDRLRMLIPLAWRNIWRNPRRTLITLVVVFVGLYSILIFSALLVAWADSSRSRALTLLTGSGQIHANGYLDDPTISRLMADPGDDLIEVLASSEIKGWVRRISLPAVIQSEYRTMPVTMVAVEPDAERTISIIPDSVTDGAYLEASDGGSIVLGEKLVNRLKTRLGKRVIILAQGTDGFLKEQSFTLSGVIAGQPEIEDQFAFTGLQTTQAMLGADGQISGISFLMENNDELDATVSELRLVEPDLDVRKWTELSPMAAIIDETMGTVIYVWLWVMFLLMSFGIINTQLMAVLERVREFGLLQALGMRPRSVLAIVLLESSFLVGTGSVLALVAAIMTVQAFSGGIDISALGDGAAMAGAGQVLYPKLDLPQLIQLSVIIWVLGVLVTLWPARKAAKSSPVEAMSHAS